MTSYEMISDLLSRLGNTFAGAFIELELRHWLNAGQQDVLRRLEGVSNEWFLNLGYAAGVAARTAYDLPADCRILRGIRLSRGLWTTNSTYESWARRIDIMEWASAKRNPDWTPSEKDPIYVQIGEQVIIEPTTQVASGTASGIEYYYSKRVAELTAFTDSETSDIREEHHDLVVLYAEIQARKREGQDVTVLQQQYENAFQHMAQNQAVARERTI